MRPRPRSRNKPIEYVPPQELVDEIRAMRARGDWPEVILVGRREWEVIRAQPEAKPYLFGLVSEEIMLDGVSVIVRPRWARPKVCTREEYEEALTGG